MPDSPTSYTDEQLSHLAEALGVQSFDADTRAKLQHAVLVYSFLIETDTMRVDRKEWKRWLGKIARAATRLRTAIDERPSLIPDIPIKIDFPNPADLEKLAHAANQVIEMFDDPEWTRRGGRRPGVARRRFIRDLGEIFQSVTGEAPTRRYDFYRREGERWGRDYGPFLEFARAAIKPIYNEHLTGLDDAVREYTEEIRRMTEGSS